MSKQRTPRSDGAKIDKEQHELTDDILGWLNDDDTIGDARAISEGLYESTREKGRALDSITIREIKKAIADYRAFQAQKKEHNGIVCIE